LWPQGDPAALAASAAALAAAAAAAAQGRPTGNAFLGAGQQAYQPNASAWYTQQQYQQYQQTTDPGVYQQYYAQQQQQQQQQQYAQGYNAQVCGEAMDRSCDSHSRLKLLEEHIPWHSARTSACAGWFRGRSAPR
jgi:hypothetical protein